MKRILLVLLISGASVSGQKISELDSLRFSDLERISYSKEYKNRLEVKNYKSSDGTWLKIGDTLEIGKPSNANNLSVGYVQGSGVNNHSHIIMGTGASAITGTIMMGNETMTGDKAIIIGLMLARLNKKNPFEIWVELNKVGGGRFMSIKKLARANLEKAMGSGEIVNPKAPLTRDEAIAKLKEAKELVELGLKTQEEFDELRKKLSPIILGEN